MIWKRTHRRRLPLIRGNGPQAPDLVLTRRRGFRLTNPRQVEVQQVLRGLFLAFGEPAERLVVRISTPAPPGPTELVTVSQLENRLVDMVRSVWLEVRPLFPEWTCSEELLQLAADSLRRDCPLVDLDTKVRAILADSESLDLYLRSATHFQNLGFVLDITEAVPSLIFPCLLSLHKRGLLDQLRDWLINGEETDPLPWPFHGVN